LYLIGLGLQLLLQTVYVYISLFSRNTVYILCQVGGGYTYMKWCHSNLWSHRPNGLHVVGQHDVLCEVKWWRFVALVEF